MRILGRRSASGTVSNRQKNLTQNLTQNLTATRAAHLARVDRTDCDIASGELAQAQLDTDQPRSSRLLAGDSILVAVEIVTLAR
jgi:hypothetical protein